MENPIEKWNKSWEEFENQLITNNWKKVSNNTNHYINGELYASVNIPVYEKEGRYLDMSGNFGYVDTICLLDEDKNFIKAVSKEKFLKEEI